VMQKSIPPHTVDQQRAEVRCPLLPCRRQDRAHRGSSSLVFIRVRRSFSLSGAGGKVRIACCETREVMHAYKNRGCCLQRLAIQTPWAHMRKARNERRTDIDRLSALDPYPILIRFCKRGVTSVETTGHPPCFQNTDRRGQRAIERTQHVVAGNGRGQVEARDLSQGVNARIGPARSLGQGCLSGDSAKCVLQLALNGRLARLHLPPSIICPVIGQSDLPGLNRRHCCKIDPGFGRGLTHRYLSEQQTN
jgi:hypothetical protein